MLLNDIVKSTIATITASNETASVTLQSEIVPMCQEDIDFLQSSFKGKRAPSFCAMHLIKYDENVIIFANSTATCNLTILYDFKPYIWVNVTIVKMNLPNLGTCHVAFSFDDVSTFNRRSEFRVWLGCAGIATFGDSQVPQDVFVRDLSPSGVGLMGPNDLSLARYTPIHLQFRYSLTKQSDPKLYTIDASIVRWTPINSSKYLIGCHMKSQNKDLTRMLYAKQRQDLKYEQEHA